QSPKPGAQLEKPHTPFTQFGVTWLPGQTTPQAPQFATFDCVSTSQPVVASLSQSAKPASHTTLQAPAVQEAVPWVPSHNLLQLPQFVGSVARVASHP